MRLLGSLLAAAIAVVLLAVPPADAATVSLVLQAPEAVRPGTSVPVVATLTQDGVPVAGATVEVEQQDGATWLPAGTALTDADGVARTTVPSSGTTMVLRARYAGTVSNQATVTVRPVTSTLAVAAPRAIVDEQAGTIAVAWTGADGLPVTGTVLVLQHVAGRPWTRLTTRSTDANGRLAVVVRPRVDTWYRVAGAAGTGWLAPPSQDRAIDNRPPLRPVVLPAQAPRPTRLPAQRRASGAGANVVVRAIPATVWNRMTGISWHRGCVARSSLRYLETNYWGFDGYRHRGELVVRASVAYKYRAAMSRLYAARVPIRAMYLPDRFGYSRKSGGANDYASMRADNTSAFNCRWVTGSPGRRSPHASGRSIDINPFENPYYSAEGWLPNTWWRHRQIGLYAWKTGSHPVVRIMRASGFAWTYGTFDAQHFDGRYLQRRVGD
ncbi:MAG: M15 family metallopeptidase [Nocardioidaceae bacterium]|nr:M15 family metallopeptidase [Nocardioidaceae bacterium]